MIAEPEDLRLGQRILCVGYELEVRGYPDEDGAVLVRCVGLEPWLEESMRRRGAATLEKARGACARFPRGLLIHACEIDD